MKTNLRNLVLLAALLIPLGLLFTGCPKVEPVIKDCDGSEISAAAFDNILEYANNLHNTTYEGTNPGNYPSGSKAILQTAINEAQGVRNQECLTQEDVTQAIDALQQAINNYEAQEIPEGGEGGEG